MSRLPCMFQLVYTCKYIFICVYTMYDCVCECLDTCLYVEKVLLKLYNMHDYLY